MKRLTISLLASFAAVAALGAATAHVAHAVSAVVATPAAPTSADHLDALWNDAGTAYYAGDFASAAALYDSIELSGQISARLYYNKGNALFKMGKIGESILYYSKAQKLAPADDDIRHNLAIASGLTRNRIEPLPEFFLRRWIRGTASLLNGNGWAITSLILFALALAGALLYLLPFGRTVRRAGFWGGVAAIVLLVFAFSFAQIAYTEAKYPSSGIVTTPSASVKSSPDSSGTDLFVLAEGDRVEIRDAMDEWSEITIANGNRGWIRSAAVSVID